MPSLFVICSEVSTECAWRTRSAYSDGLHCLGNGARLDDRDDHLAVLVGLEVIHVHPVGADSGVDLLEGLHRHVRRRAGNCHATCEARARRREEGRRTRVVCDVGGLGEGLAVKEEGVERVVLVAEGLEQRIFQLAECVVSANNELLSCKCTSLKWRPVPRVTLSSALKVARRR